MSRAGRALRLAAALIALSAPAGLSAQEASAYDRAVAARLAGDPAEARQLLTAWLADHPDDVDARLQLAYADLALGRLAAAESGFRAVLAAAPDYQDARDGLDRLAEARGSAENAAYLTLEGALSDLDGGLPGWREAGVALAGPVAPATTLEGRATWNRRFGREDVEVGALLTSRVGENLWLRGGIGATPQADFRPKMGITGGFDWRIAPGDNATVLTFDARYEDFPAQHVATLSTGIVQYFAHGSVWLTARGFGVIPQSRPMQTGFLVRADVEPSTGYRLFAGVADGPDTELGTVTRVSSLFGGAEVPLSKQFSVTGALARETRKGPADRTEFRLGIKARL